MVNSFPQETSLQSETDANAGDCISSAVAKLDVIWCHLTAPDLQVAGGHIVAAEQSLHYSSLTLSFVFTLEGASPTLTMQV